MLKSLAHWRTTQNPKFFSFFFFRSSSSSSSSLSSPRSSKFHNYYLRKRRKWPHPVYKSRWHQKLGQQHAMQALRNQASSSNNLLFSLINSFSLYNCDPTPNSYHFVIETLIKTSQFHQIPPVLNQLENVEKFQTPESIFVDLIELLGKKNKYQEAIDLFFRLPNFRCTPTVDSLNCLISVLCKQKQGFHLVPLVLLKSRSMNIRPEEFTFTILIKALCRFKTPKNAIALLYHLVDHDIDIDHRSFSIILSTLCQQKDVTCDQITGLLEEMKILGFRVGKSDWGNVIRFLAKRGMGMEAFKALNQMKFDGFKPDVLCYTMVMDAMISEGDYKSADQLFDEMLVLGLVPNIHTYNVYVNGLCKQKKFDDGFAILSSMEETGCKPNMITYNTLLTALYENGELGMANEFLKNVNGKCGLLNLQTYEMLLYRIVNTNDISVVLDLVKEPLVFDEIVCRLCTDGFVLKALNLLTEMLGKNVQPGCQSWEALIVGFHIEHGFKETDFNLVIYA